MTSFLTQTRVAPLLTRSQNHGVKSKQSLFRFDNCSFRVAQLKLANMFCNEKATFASKKLLLFK